MASRNSEVASDLLRHEIPPTFWTFAEVISSEFAWGSIWGWVTWGFRAWLQSMAECALQVGSVTGYIMVSGTIVGLPHRASGPGEPRASGPGESKSTAEIISLLVSGVGLKI